ncbi:MAG: hypothetical protein K8S56_06015, partial [Candidatus Cloacimonetes bacterium]|nr:hypothetical protein [Candidatus Cloacimonadota bacterium]
MQYDTAVKIYKKIRKATNNPSLYSQQIANIYFADSRFEDALEEWLFLLSTNKSFLHYVNRQLKTVLGQDPGFISKIKIWCDIPADKQKSELYARSLEIVENYEQAMDIYARLSPQKLMAFASSRINKGDLTLGLTAYHRYLQLKIDEQSRIAVQMSIARIYLKQSEISKAEALLDTLLNITEGKASSQVKYADIEARRMLAEIAIRKREPEEKVVELLNQALSLTRNAQQRKVIYLELVHYYMYSGYYDKATQTLGKVRRQQKRNAPLSHELRLFDYYLSILRGEIEIADSLLNEIVLSSPGHFDLNEILRISFYTQDMSEQALHFFLTGWRLGGLFRYSEA